MPNYRATINMGYTMLDAETGDAVKRNDALSLEAASFAELLNKIRKPLEAMQKLSVEANGVCICLSMPKLD